MKVNCKCCNFIAVFSKTIRGTVRKNKRKLSLRRLELSPIAVSDCLIVSNVLCVPKSSVFFLNLQRELSDFRKTLCEFRKAFCEFRKYLLLELLSLSDIGTLLR